jgi:hypothetical protein
LERDCDLFEEKDDNLLWRGTLTGRENALVRLKELAAGPTNEVCVMHIPTKLIIAKINAGQREKEHA